MTNASDIQLLGWRASNNPDDARAMTMWAIRNSSGEILSEFSGASHQEVGRKVLPTRYDPFRLQVSSSYRGLFERAVRSTLERECWQIVRVRCCVTPNRVSGASRA
jgi:hypothetical protein